MLRPFFFSFSGVGCGDGAPKIFKIDLYPHIDLVDKESSSRENSI